MQKDLFEAAKEYIGAGDAPFAEIANDVRQFIAGAAWGLQAAKLSQAEIAAIVAAVATKKDK